MEGESYLQSRRDRDTFEILGQRAFLFQDLGLLELPEQVLTKVSIKVIGGLQGEFFPIWVTSLDFFAPPAQRSDPDLRQRCQDGPLLQPLAATNC